ncbi:MAG: flagellar hook-length control protein FliK [Gammaproteobacteria bacterium]|nr:MAG: flagellar hook-length control protein FliK [Gammaproteobacteria bacterium]
MLPMLSPLTLPTPQSGPSSDPMGSTDGLTEGGQAADIHGVSGDFEATLALLNGDVSGALAGALASPAIAAALTRVEGQGLPPGGMPLPSSPGTLAGSAAAGGPIWQPGELLSLLAGEGARAGGAARLDLSTLFAAGAGPLGEGSGSAAGQAQAGLARLDGLLLDLGAGAGSARGPGAGGALAGGAAAGLLAGQAALVPDAPGFGQGLGQRLIAMVQQGLQQAQLRIHPEHLGPLEVRLRTEGDAVQVTLASPHASVREALESALPRLRDTLAEHGLSLAQADVGGGEREAAGRGDGEADTAPGGWTEDGEGDGSADTAGDGRLTPRSISLVDTFA